MKKMILALALIASVTATAADRTWVLSGTTLANILIANNVAPSVGASSTSSKQIILLQAGVNMGQYELGPIFTFRNEDDGTTVTKTSGLGAYGKYNFVDNTTGVTIVPFAKLQLDSATVKTGANSTNNVSYLLAGGATFYPFNDIVGIDGQQLTKMRKKALQL